MGELKAGLVACAGSFRRDGVAITDARGPDSGMSSDTVMFQRGGEAVVVRPAPAPESPFPDLSDVHTRRSLACDSGSS